MTGSHIPHLRRTLRDLFQDGAVHHEMMTEATGEEIHLLARGEYEAGLALLDELVDRDGSFPDHDALVVVRETLVGYLNEIEDGFPLKKRLLRSLIGQISAVEKTAFSEDGLAA